VSETWDEQMGRLQAMIRGDHGDLSERDVLAVQAALTRASRSAPPAPERAEIERLREERDAARYALENERQKCCLHIDYRALDAVLKEHGEPNTGREPSQRVAERLAAYRALAAQDGLREAARVAVERLGEVERDLNVCTWECAGCGRSEPIADMDLASPAREALATLRAALSTPAAPKKENDRE
jgi:hypothetical protein